MAKFGRILGSVSIFIISAGVAGGVTDDYAVSPDLAKKAAVYDFVRTYGEHCLEEGYEYFLISEPEIISSYRGERKWYSFYMVTGTGDLPTRDEMIAWERVGKYEPEGGHIYHVPISASRRYAPTGWYGGGAPPELRWRYRAEECIVDVTGGRVGAISAAYYSHWAINGAFFLYEVYGQEYVFMSASNSVKNAAEISEEPPGDAEKYRYLWERIDKLVPLVVIGGEKIYFRDVLNNISP
ncbi:MAG: hypothetical protein PVH29_09210 [Candidatus Zixiibacteriota bacterium]|jgi:hypothetical protein